MIGFDKDPRPLFRPKFVVGRSALPVDYTGSDPDVLHGLQYPGALTVPFHPPAGTAVSGADYAAFGAAVTIPPGQPSTTLTLSALDDAVPEPPESVVLCLKADAAYRLGSCHNSGVISDVSVDLDVDSNSDAKIDRDNSPNGTDDPFEDNAGLGKVLKVNDDDTDDDGVPDYADGFDHHNAWPAVPHDDVVSDELFTPVELTLAAGIDYDDATFTLAVPIGQDVTGQRGDRSN